MVFLILDIFQILPSIPTSFLLKGLATLIRDIYEVISGKNLLPREQIHLHLLYSEMLDILSQLS